MTTFKKMCNIHRFNYSGMKCPFCEQERISKLASKFIKKDIKKDNKEITQEDIERLKNKFNK